VNEIFPAADELAIPAPVHIRRTLRFPSSLYKLECPGFGNAFTHRFDYAGGIGAGVYGAAGLIA
jgi:hypothetical protein